MQNSVHGHTVINLVKAQPGYFSQDSLIQAVKAEHGDARFHTCSQQDLTLEQLIAFLLDRKKLLEQGGKLSINDARICNHP